MKTVFVTGVNGLLGTNLTHLLLSRGYFVKGLVRDKSRYAGNHTSGLQLIEGDLFDDFTKVLSNVDYVVHIAAITCQNLLNYADYRMINGNATIQLFHAAARCKVQRFIYVSSANTLGHGSIDKPGNEDDPVRQPFSKSLYAKSKKEAENQLLNNKHMMETIIVNPTFMLGAFDTKPNSGKIILMGWRKKVIFYPPGGKNFVHVEDVADGIIKSIENGRNGEKYILANENLSYTDFFTKLNTISNQKPAMIKIPRALLLGIGIFGDLLRGLRIKTSLSLVNMKILCTNNFYTNKKSITDLGVSYRPVELAITDALNHFKNKRIKERSNKTNSKMKHKHRIKTSLLVALVLLLTLTVCSKKASSQQKSWSTTQDIRQLTELATCSGWETLKQDKGVTLSSRWLSFGDSVKTREIAVYFVADADIEHLLANLTKPEGMIAWNNGVRSIDVLKQQGSTWITHTVYDIPYPFSQQDLVVQNVMTSDQHKTTILLSALPDYIATLKDVTRQQLYFGKWELKPLDNGATEVKFSALSFSKSGVPRFIRDPIVQNMLFNSFLNLKQLSSVEEVAKKIPAQLSSSRSLNRKNQ